MQPIVVLVIIVFIVIAVGTPRRPRIKRYDYPPFPPYPTPQPRAGSSAGLKILLLLSLILGSVIFATGGFKKFLDMIDLPPRDKTEQESDKPKEANVADPLGKTLGDEETPPTEFPKTDNDLTRPKKQEEAAYPNPTDTAQLPREEKVVAEKRMARDTTLPQHPYTVQVAASNSYPWALSQAKEWRGKLDVPVFIGVKDPEFSLAYKILLGDFPSEADAKKWCPKLQKLTGENNCWVRRFSELSLVRQDNGSPAISTARNYSLTTQDL